MEKRPISDEELARSAFPLENERREAFAQAVARGMSCARAAEKAGFGFHRHGARLARARDVAARIGAIRASLAGGGSRELGPLIDRLLGIFVAGVTLNNAAALVAARSALVEAARLKQLLPFAPGEGPPAAAPAPTGEPFHWTDKEMSDEEWNAHFGPEAPGGKIDYNPGESQ
ncbi:MAG TPA: hypothetical protein VGS12_15055 [Caulobacteraceae bacterium]|nr:hypothetical protein [Caulobacteraceae bacterium]